MVTEDEVSEDFRYAAELFAALREAMRKEDPTDASFWTFLRDYLDEVDADRAEPRQ